VVVSFQAQGGRSGWREIGRFTSAAGQTVRIEMSGAEPRLRVDGVERKNDGAEQEVPNAEQPPSASEAMNATDSSERRPEVSE